MDTPRSLLRRIVEDEGGATAIEYGLLAALIVVAAIGAIGATGQSLEAIYVYWSTAVTAAL